MSKSNQTKAANKTQKKPAGKVPDHAPRPKAADASRQHIWLAVICALIAFLLYANTIGHGYVLDDDVVSNSNPIVQKGFKGISEAFSVDMWHFYNANLGYYRPLSLVTFAIEGQFAPHNAHVSHFDNVLLYALTAFFLCLLLQRVFRSYSPYFAFAVTLIFVVHPIHTEVVANIKSRDEILSFLNLVLAIYFVFRALDRQVVSYKLFGLAAFFFYLALLSKETAMAGLLIIPLLLFFAPSSASFKSGKLNITAGKLLLYTLPFFLVFIFFQVQKQVMIGSGGDTEIADLVNYPYAAGDARLPSMFILFAWCIRLVLVPYPLCYNYAYNQIPAGEWSSPLWIGGLIAALALVYIGFKNIRGRSAVSLGVLLYGITMAPAMGFVLLKGGILAERFLYAPALGFGIVIVALLALLFKAPVNTPKAALSVFTGNIKLMAPLGILLITFAVLTLVRNPQWHSNYILFSHDVAVAANSTQVHFHLGDEYLLRANVTKDESQRKALFDKAIKELRRSLDIDPQYAESAFSIGVAYHQIEVNADSAEYYYKLALRASPAYALAWNNLGNLCENTGRQELASYYYNKAVRCNPYYVDGLNNHKRHKATYGLDVRSLPASVKPL